MIRALLKKQLLELGAAFVRSSKTDKRRSRAGAFGYALLFAVLMLLVMLSFGSMALPLAVLIAFSRMYLCVHFPTDILGGAVLGTACGWLGAWAIKKLKENKTVRPR